MDTNQGDEIGRITVESLPNEILLQIFSLLDGHDLLQCREVSAVWRNIASDGFLWQTKLCELFGQRWSVVSCEKKPENAPDLSNLNKIHPYTIYRFLVDYVPQHLRSEPDRLAAKAEVTRKPSGLAQQIQRSPRPSLSELIAHWWNQVVRRITLSSPRRNGRITPPQYRFAVFGPGFDQRATSRLFSKLVDTRTKSFEPINMIPGRMGFGAGLTLKLHAQAQLAVFDPSLSLPKSCPSITPRFLKDLHTTEKETTESPCSSQTANGTIAVTSVPLEIPRSPLWLPVSTTPDNSVFRDDLIFDLHYLYSLRGHLSHTFSDQLDRLLRSRLFRHSIGDASMTDEELLSNLTVTESMQNILRGLNGMIYALDARETVEQSCYLHCELHAVLRGLPKTVAKRVPIVFLYIMPKEDIDLTPFAPQVKRRSVNSSNISAFLNRDSYSGVDYTVSWRGSLLLPISCLRLFELDNPWRLQKCASNDIKAVIQGIMWLRARAPLVPNEQMYQLMRVNSAV
ncbi:hypothetical protein EG68_01271 [Paragonimus skrjabini miyazakii]|uniref:F-box domain-containing protein n=1 Tax=Paragonimus skrjabini miyazakii TaxID=59628 RepID=A0A8S9Z2E4_9TREM|nr:hypothetical protein EG68_01271 [Paragonimus skrjabini miyazakii]